MKEIIFLFLILLSSSCDFLDKNKVIINKNENKKETLYSQEKALSVKKIVTNKIISEKKGYYYKSVIAVEKEFNFSDSLESNAFLYKNSSKIRQKYINGYRPICPGMPNKESCIKKGYGNIINRYIIGENTYNLVSDFENRDKYYIFKNNKLIFEDSIVMVGAWSPYKAYELNNKLLFIYTKNKGDNTVLYNILYDEQSINKKYDFKNIDGFFIYKGIEGFIVNKTQLYFNNKILPYKFDYIQNTACCTGASLFEIYNNGMLIFANKRGSTINDLEFDLIEIDLNNFVEK